MGIEIKPRITAGILCALAFLCALSLIRTEYHIALIPTVFFSISFFISLVREVVVTTGENEIGMNTISATVAGAAVVLYTNNSPLGFILTMLVMILYPANIRKHQWNYLSFNVANNVIAGTAVFASLRFLNFSISANLLEVIVKVFFAAVTYELVNYVLLAVDSAIRKEKWRELLYDLRKSLFEVIPLAAFSGLLGKFYFDYGSFMLLMFSVPLVFGRELAASYAKMAETQKSTLDTLTRTLEAKDKYTAGHVERVAMFAKYIGEELGYGPRHLERIRQAALLHDAGKLIVPSALLNKPGRLTDEEFKIIQRHEFVTIEILSMIDFLAPIAELAGGDHNNMEGKSVRNLDPFIVSACDAFDAMTSSRSYRKALKMEVAFEELHSKEGKQFHPKVVEALINAIESRGEHYGDGYEVDAVHADAPEAGLGSAGIGDLEETESAVELKGVSQNLDTQVSDSSDSGTDGTLHTESHTIPSVKRSSIAAEASVELSSNETAVHEQDQPN